MDKAKESIFYSKIKSIYAKILNGIDASKLDKKNLEILNGLQRTVIEKKSIKYNKKMLRRNLEKFFAVALLTTPMMTQTTAKPVQPIPASKFVDNVVLKTESGKDINASFYSNSVNIKDSYTFNFEERVDALNKLLDFAEDNNIEIQRSLKKLESEWFVHNVCYNLGIEKDRAKDVDLDYVEDQRWYINFATDIASMYYGLHGTFDSYAEDVNVK